MVHERNKTQQKDKIKRNKLEKILWNKVICLCIWYIRMNVKLFLEETNIIKRCIL